MLTFSEAFDRITTFESTGVLFEWIPNMEDLEDQLAEGNFKEKPPSQMGYKADILSLVCLFRFEIKPQTSYLPRKKKKRLAMHYKKKYNKLNKELRRRYD